MAKGCAKGQVYKPVLESWDELASMRIPEYDGEACAQRVRARFSDDTGDHFKVCPIGGWVFDNARYLRKMEVYLLDLAMYPDEVRAMHAKVGEVYEQKIHAAGRGGANAIVIGEDMGTQQGLLVSPDMFRDYFKDLYSRLMGLAHDYGMKVLMHSCGQNREIIDDLIECGVDAFQFDQPAVYDMAELSNREEERDRSCDGVLRLSHRVLPPPRDTHHRGWWPALGPARGYTTVRAARLPSIGLPV